jgi:3-deoxy-D-manno-octulosonic-acid transferase
VLRSNPRAILLLVPRHPERGADIAKLLESDGWTFAQRSTGALPDRDTQVYLADSLGELGLWYRLAPISFLGGSLVDIGGHNPFEPAALGSAILYGPYVSNFTDIFDRLQAVDAARQVRDSESLARAVDELMNPERAAAMANAAWEVSSTGAAVTDRALNAILERLEQREADQRNAST